MTWRTGVLVVGGLLAVLAGCSVRMAPVEGVVTPDGKPWTK